MCATKFHTHTKLWFCISQSLNILIQCTCKHIWMKLSKGLQKHVDPRMELGQLKQSTQKWHNITYYLCDWRIFCNDTELGNCNDRNIERVKPGREQLVHKCNALGGNYRSFLATELVRSTLFLATVKWDGINIGRRACNLQMCKSTVRHTREVVTAKWKVLNTQLLGERGGLETSLFVICVSK